MARSDLLIALVKAGSAGDKRGVRAAAEAIIAEEHAKQHKVLAERLRKAIQMNGNGMHAVASTLDSSSTRVATLSLKSCPADDWRTSSYRLLAGGASNS